MSRPRLRMLAVLAALTCGSFAARLFAQETPQSGPAAPPPPESAAASPARTTSLQGTAILGRSRPVAGATVLAAARSGPARIFVTSTDGRGTFLLDNVPEGAYDVEFLRDGLEAVRKEKVEVRAPFRAIVEVTMRAASASAPPARVERAPAAEAGTLTLGGHASGRDGQPLSDVRVRIVRRDAAEDPREVRSGADGSFEVGSLAPGEFELDSGGLGVLPVRARFRLQESGQLRLVLVSQPTVYEPSPLELLPPEEPIPPPAG